MNNEEKILKAKVQLILEQPFFATLALRMQYHADETEKTSVTNGLEIKYNPAYIDSLSIPETKAVIAHEVMHIAMMHHLRRSHRDITKWNQATDYAINPLLLDSGFTLPEGYLLSDNFRGKSAEQIFQELQDPPPATGSPNNADTGSNNSQPNNQRGQTGQVDDIPKTISAGKAEAEIKQALAQAVLVAKKQGKLPAHIERLVTEILKPLIDWREALARFLTEITRDDYCWQKPSRRYLYNRLYLPSLESEDAGTLILLVDTSSSINKVLLNQFAAEVQSMASVFRIPLQVIYVDAKVQRIQDIDQDEPVQLHPKGGGGTDFRPGFTYIEESGVEPRAVVYLTDGDCHSFPEPPDYPVIWAQFGQKSFTPPFGEIIQVQ